MKGRWGGREERKKEREKEEKEGYGWDLLIFGLSYSLTLDLASTL